MFTVGKVLIPFFAACGDMMEILKDGERFCVIRGDAAEAQKVVDALNHKEG